jgi:RNA polymerase sigma factor (TIGR02999 family)
MSAQQPGEQITALLNAARAGDDSAYARVIVLLYQDLRNLARAIARDPSATLNPTALLHETYLKLTASSGALPINREHFLSLAARAMRQVLCNHARDQIAQKRGGGAMQVTLDRHETAVSFEIERLLDLDHALSELEREDADLVRIVECRMFAGMSEEETATALELPLRTLQRRHAQARDALRERLAGPGRGQQSNAD